MSTPRCSAEGGPDPRSAVHRSPDPATSALALALAWERTRRDYLEPGELLRWADELYDCVRTLLRDASVRRTRQSLPADVWSSLESVFWASAAGRVTLSLLSEETVDNVEQDLHRFITGRGGPGTAEPDADGSADEDSGVDDAILLRLIFSEFHRALRRSGQAH